MVHARNAGTRGAAILLASLVAAAACSPFPSANESAPRLQRVLAIDATFSQTVPPAEADAPEPGVSPEQWALTEVDATRLGIVAVQFTKLMDPGTIQPDPTTCSPLAPGLHVSVNGEDASAAFSSCYEPTSPTPEQGATMLVYATPASGSIGDAKLASTTTYRITGTVKDEAGRALELDVTVATK